MYLYLDESYNLRDRSKKQFISINGFMTVQVATIRKKWLQARKLYLGKRKRVHANDSQFNAFNKKAFKIINANQVSPISIFQEIGVIPPNPDKKYFIKGKLNFDKVYTDLCKKLLFSLNLDEYKKVIITIDNRKHKAGIIGKSKFRDTIERELRAMYPGTVFEKPRLVPSTSDVLLEMCDFVSNSFYRYYLNNEQGQVKDFEAKIYKIKNPLK